MGIIETRLLKGAGFLNEIYGSKAVEREVKIKPPKVPKPIPKRSEKMKGVMKELKKLYPVFLAKNKLCAIQGPECSKKATCIHHSAGRIGDKVLDVKTWVASCEPCNGWVEDHHAEAAKKGFKKSKFIK